MQRDQIKRDHIKNTEFILEALCSSRQPKVINTFMIKNKQTNKFPKSQLGMQMIL